MHRFLVSVIGGHMADKRTEDLAERVGEVIASSGAVLVCGGLSGVMEASARGAKKCGGTTIGIIPGENKDEANPHIDIVITTGMGYTRNTIVAGTADIVIALEGSYGTLSEIAFALTAKKTVLGLGSWEIPGVEEIRSPEEAAPVIKNMMEKM